MRNRKEEDKKKKKKKKKWRRRIECNGCQKPFRFTEGEKEKERERKRERDETRRDGGRDTEESDDRRGKETIRASANRNSRLDLITAASFRGSGCESSSVLPR